MVKYTMPNTEQPPHDVSGDMGRGTLTALNFYAEPPFHPLEMTGIADLALEILQEIVNLLPHTCPTHDPPPTSFNSTEVGYPLKEATNRYRRLAPLRTTCRAFDDAIQPILFSEIVIDCLHTRLDAVRSQFESLSSGTGHWRRHARSLKIVNLDPCYDRRPSGGGVQYWEEYLSQEQREAAHAMEDLIQADLLASIRNGFCNLEAVSWFVRQNDPVRELTDCLAGVKTLKSLDLILWSDQVIPNFPLDSFSNLSHVSVFFFHDDRSKRIDGIWFRDARQLFQRLRLLVESSPELSSLRIGRKYRERQSIEDLDIPLFPSEFLLTPAASRLTSLALRRFDLVEIDEDSIPWDYYTRFTQNLVSLTTLDLTECGYYTCPAIWNALMFSNILLSNIKVDYITTGLMKYLHRPDVPLKSLTLLLHHFSLFEDLDWGQAGEFALQTYTTVLDAHRDTIQTLDFSVMPQNLWWVEVEKIGSGEAPSRYKKIYLEDTSLLQCRNLRKLGLTLDLRDAEGHTELTPNCEAVDRKINKLMKELSTLPKLEEVTIYYPEQTMSAYYESRPHIHTAIRDMIITPSDSEKFGFDIVFQEARYQLVAPGFLVEGDHDDDRESRNETTARGWRFVDINAEEDDVIKEEDEEGEGEDSWALEAAMQLVPFDADDTF